MILQQFLEIKNYFLQRFNKIINMGIGDWGFGIGDWGLKNWEK